MHGLGNDFIVFDAPADGTPAHRRAVARARRASYRHRLRPGAGARAAAPRRHRRSTTASSTPTAARSSSAATARAASPRSCIAAARSQRQRRDHARQPRRASSARASTTPNLVSVDMGVPNFDPQVPAVRRVERSARLSARRRGHRSGDRRGVDGQSARRAHRVVGRERAGGSARPGDRDASALPEARERRLHGSRRSRAHPAARVTSVARAKHSPAAPAPARLSPSADATAGSTPTSKSQLPRRRARDQLAAPGEHIWMKGPADVSFKGRVEF